MPSWVSEWDKVLLYSLSLTLFYAIIHGNILVPDLLEALEFVAFAFGLSSMMKLTFGLADLRRQLALEKVLGKIPDIDT